MSGRWMQVFSILQRLVISRFGSSLIGLIAVIALIWYAGPLLGITSASTRLMMIGGAVLVAALYFGIKLFVSTRKGDRLVNDLSEQGEGGDDDRAAELESIREKMNEAIASLKSSELGAGYRGKAALYALPWYMIIGPSAAGKSTLLRQSGLHFPYANADDLHLRGFGGTRNCDWWFSDQAILLDTAGRYTTEDDDREEWLTFLDLLRRNRPRMPINGVLICISISDLLTADSEGLERHVKILRERINELMQQLGLVFPVYIVFTKCDLIQGFETYFEDLSETERNQVWGTYLLETDEEQDPATVFEERMRELYGKLCELRLRKLAMQRNMTRKATLFDFPNQFDAATDKLTEFIHLLFRANPYQETPRFAGVYFTSGTQEGTPLQRLVGNLRQAFGFAQEPTARTGQPKAYFIKNLFTDVIFPLQSLVRGNRRRILTERWLKGAALGSALAVIVGTVLTLSGAFTTNGLLLASGTSAVSELRQVVRTGYAEPQQQYRALEGVYDHYHTLLEYQQNRPLVSRIGVYTGHRQIPALESVLETTMDGMFRDRIVRSLEHRLENHARHWETADNQGRERLRDNYYQALKVYLMTVRVPERLDIDEATPLLADLWAQQVAFADVDQPYREVRNRAPHMERMVRFYLSREGDIQWEPRNELITQAQNHLRTPPNAEQLYEQIVNKGNVDFEPIGVDDLVTGQNRRVLRSDHQVPGVYSAKAWDSFVRAEIALVVEGATRGDWVLSEELDNPGEADSEDEVVDYELAQHLERAIREYYFRDYAENWLTFLGSVTPRRFGSLEEGVSILNQLARSDGPIAELMQATARNINLTDRDVSRLRGGNISPERMADAMSGYNRVAELDVRLADLRRFANPAEQQSVSEPMSQYLTVLSGAKNDLERIAASVDPAREAKNFAAGMLTGGAQSELYGGWVMTNGLLSGTEMRTRQAMEPFLIEPIRFAWGAVLTEARQQVQRDWRNNVLNVYRQQINGKFPFAANGPDAAVDDVAEFFRPDDGVLWNYIERDLSAFIDEERQGWEERRWLGLGLGFSQDFLRSLGGARHVSYSLFRRGGMDPDMTFHVYPVPVRGLSEMVLETNGHVYRYRNEPQEWRRFSWPGDADRIGARVSGVSQRGQVRAEQRATGHWGLFHLLRDAKISHEGGTVYLAEWELEGSNGSPVTVRFRVRADRQHNVFRRQLIGFGLPADPFAGVDIWAVNSSRGGR
ncbi:hypothetical protein CAI21_08420 [Alkalilimnicola ehrlichii]|uniref:Type VI secretion system membrane subunit TssM n=1 Tax=Alkalilimnicola ehrlichii TaxID=351052 RepID=A0A3E0WWZ1_9GAMM|nr:type VI secretion system membrane subunit TssM [Alkalilimnicola ehrlichii]RFA29849.1 hypothetical protein CAI21_08420 [Alkalilimnicola ehrlichii]RFA36437.1 hypothetical protein CAL65_10685 [Alkalilimnicola ehrlichii]